MPGFRYAGVWANSGELILRLARKAQEYWIIGEVFLY